MQTVTWNRENHEIVISRNEVMANTVYIIRKMFCSLCPNKIVPTYNSLNSNIRTNTHGRIKLSGNTGRKEKTWLAIKHCTMYSRDPPSSPTILIGFTCNYINTPIKSFWTKPNSVDGMSSIKWTLTNLYRFVPRSGCWDL